MDIYSANFLTGIGVHTVTKYFMQELIKSDWNYILYENNNRLLLSVMCGSVGLFDRNIYLNDLEKSLFVTEGQSYVEKIAVQIRSNPAKYESRHVKI